MLAGSSIADSDEGAGQTTGEPLLRPIKVVSTSGNVQNEALLESHGGYAIWTMAQGGAAPVIILE